MVFRSWAIVLNRLSRTVGRAVPDGPNSRPAIIPTQASKRRSPKHSSSPRSTAKQFFFEQVRVPSSHRGPEMVVIEMEPEPEETTRPASPVRGEQAAPAAGGEAPRAEDEEEAFEDALTDEQLREKARSQANAAKAEGNKLFGAGQYEEALSQYEMALQIAAELESAEDMCSACHSNRAVCFLKLGKYDDTIKECTKALELNPSYLKALLRRAEAHEKLEHYDEAIADMKKVLEFDPSNQQAKRSLFRLEPLAAEKREKMKEEMIEKLKELGNSVLGRFGMCVDNFKAVKDPNTGSYSISFQK